MKYCSKIKLYYYIY